MPDTPFVIAIIGAGPSGIYAAEALSQQADVPVQVVVLDRLPVPFGLVRYGVAPDHHSIRSIRNTLERTLQKPEVRFYGDVRIGRDIKIDELRGVVDAVIYAFGAGTDRRLDIPGEDLPGSLAAQEFVAWYCGHPDVHPDTDPAIRGATNIADLMASTAAAVVVGVGNVALDVARVLTKSRPELAGTDMAADVLSALDAKSVTDVHILGRRGPAYTTFTTKELRELGKMEDVDVIVDGADFDLDPDSERILAGDKIAARNVAVMREWVARPPGRAARRIHLHFWTRPIALCGSDRVQSVRVERTLLKDGAVRSAGGDYAIDAQLVVRSVGYKGTPLPGIPFEPATGRVPHAEGRVQRDGQFSPDEYVTGWIKRGPTGVIGTNKSDAVETVTSLLTDIAEGDIAPGHRIEELDQLLASRGIHPLDIGAWRRINAVEIQLGKSQGRERTTLARRRELLAAAQPNKGTGFPSALGDTDADPRAD